MLQRPTIGHPGCRLCITLCIRPQDTDAFQSWDEDDDEEEDGPAGGSGTILVPRWQRLADPAQFTSSFRHMAAAVQEDSSSRSSSAPSRIRPSGARRHQQHPAAPAISYQLASSSWRPKPGATGAGGFDCTAGNGAGSGLLRNAGRAPAGLRGYDCSPPRVLRFAHNVATGTEDSCGASGAVGVDGGFASGLAIRGRSSMAIQQQAALLDAADPLQGGTGLAEAWQALLMAGSGPGIDAKPAAIAAMLDSVAACAGGTHAVDVTHAAQRRTLLMQRQRRNSSVASQREVHAAARGAAGGSGQGPQHSSASWLTSLDEADGGRTDFRQWIDNIKDLMGELQESMDDVSGLATVSTASSSAHPARHEHVHR